MTLTLSPRKRIMRERTKKVKARKAALRRAGRTYYDLAALARVTHSMVWKWMNGERVSASCEQAFRVLTGNGNQRNTP
jgi:hypothetical protein